MQVCLDPVKAFAVYATLFALTTVELVGYPRHWENVLDVQSFPMPRTKGLPAIQRFTTLSVQLSPKQNPGLLIVRNLSLITGGGKREQRERCSKFLYDLSQCPIGKAKLMQSFALRIAVQLIHYLARILCCLKQIFRSHPKLHP